VPFSLIYIFRHADNNQFGGKQGFQKAPTPNNFYVPYHASLGQIITEVLYQGNIPSKEIYANTDVAGAGIYGSTHTERGLTFVQTKLAGHEIPQVSQRVEAKVVI
jgi:carboxypeptidase D